MIVDADILRARRHYPAGRKLRMVPEKPRKVVDVIRKHMNDNNVTLKMLSVAWHCSPPTVSTTLSRGRKRPLSPQYIDAVVELMKLDDFDATELYRMAALEAGYRIDGPRL